MTHVVNGEEQTAIIERLLEQAKKAGFRIKRLLYRGFHAAQTMSWLQEHSISFIIPMLHRGKGNCSSEQSTTENHLDRDLPRNLECHPCTYGVSNSSQFRHTVLSGLGS